MKLLITVSFILNTLPIFSQTFATRLLFGQSHLVFKGKVNNFVAGWSDAEKNEFEINTTVLELYKNEGAWAHELAGKKLSMRTIKIIEYDSLTYEFINTNEFHVSKDSTYVFFVQRFGNSTENKSVYWGELVARDVEGIPFSEALEKDLESFNEYYYVEDEMPGISFDLLLQSSQTHIVADVIDINENSAYYDYAITIQRGKEKPIVVKAKDLVCICKEGTLKLNHQYLFFLTPQDNGEFILTDRWLGIYEYNSSLKAWMNVNRKKY